MATYLDSAERNHFVYRAYDSTGRLLYVGCTKRLDKRWAEHKWERRAMVDATVRVRLQGPYRRAVAREIERVAIRTEDPFIGWTPTKHRINCQRAKWINRRILTLVDHGVEVWAAIEQAVTEVDGHIADPNAAENEFLGRPRWATKTA